MVLVYLLKVTAYGTLDFVKIKPLVMTEKESKIKSARDHLEDLEKDYMRMEKLIFQSEINLVCICACDNLSSVLHKTEFASACMKIIRVLIPKQFLHRIQFHNIWMHSFRTFHFQSE